MEHRKNWIIVFTFRRWAMCFFLFSTFSSHLRGIKTVQPAKKSTYSLSGGGFWANCMGFIWNGISAFFWISVDHPLGVEDVAGWQKHACRSFGIEPRGFLEGHDISQLGMKKVSFECDCTLIREQTQSWSPVILNKYHCNIVPISPPFLLLRPRQIKQDKKHWH